MKKKKELILSILGIISLLLVTLGISLAFFSYTKEGVKENAVTTGSITFLYTEVSKVGNGIRIEDTFPKSDEEGKAATGVGEYFDFKVESTLSRSDIEYEVVAEPTEDSTLPLDAIKLYLTEVTNEEENAVESCLDSGGRVKTLDEYNDTLIENASGKTIYQETILRNTKGYVKNFRVRMWINEDIDWASDGYIGTTTSIKINVYANSDKSMAATDATNPQDTSIERITANNMYLFLESSEEEIDYELTVPKEVEELEILVTPSNTEATVSIKKIDSLAINSNIRRLSTISDNLIPGENYYKAVVTSSDKTKTEECILRVIREKDRDNTLLILEVDGYSLNPIFDKEVTNYTLLLEASSIEIKAETTSKVATVTGIGTKELSWGENEIDVIVTAQDGTIRTYKITINNVRPTAPTITGGSSSWVSTAPTIKISQPGGAISEVKEYEYYKSTSNTTPTDSTTATGTTTGNLTISDQGTSYVWYRTVSNNGFKSPWTSSPQVINLDTTTPTVTINSSLPSSVTKGDSYTILGSYTANGSSGGSVSCSSNLNGTITNTSSLTTVGTHTITCTAKTGAGKTATATKIVKITYAAYVATNLIKNGSFENGSENWSLNNAVVTTYQMNSTNGCYTAATGNYNLRFQSGTSTTYQDLDYTAPTLNHKYYGRLLHLNPYDFSTGDSRFEWWYNDIAGAGTLIFARKSQVCECWGLLSSVQTITNSTYLSNKWVLRNFYVSMSPEAYVDDLVLIDLTATFGAGNEPDKDWCDKHIYYFDGSTTIYK